MVCCIITDVYLKAFVEVYMKSFHFMVYLQFLSYNFVLVCVSRQLNIFRFPKVALQCTEFLMLGQLFFQGIASIPLGTTHVSGIATLAAPGTPKIVSAANMSSMAGLRVINPSAVGQQSTIKVTPVAGGVRTAGLLMLFIGGLV